MKPFESLLAGCFLASFVVMLGAKVAGTRVPLGFGVGYFAFALVVGLITCGYARKWNDLRMWTPRVAFVAPFLPFFLIPLGIATVYVVDGSRMEHGLLRNAVITLAYIAAVLSIMLFIRLSIGPSRNKPKSPQRNAGIGPAISDEASQSRRAL